MVQGMPHYEVITLSSAKRDRSLNFLYGPCSLALEAGIWFGEEYYFIVLQNKVSGSTLLGVCMFQVLLLCCDYKEYSTYLDS